MRKVVFVFCLMCLIQGINAQPFSKKIQYTSIGGSLNAMNYIGDIDPSPSLMSPSILHTRYNFGIELVQRVRPRVSYRAAISWGRVAGSDRVNASYHENDIYRKVRNLSFRNNIFEVKADMIVDLFGNRRSFLKRPEYVPYVFTGIAYFHHNPMARTPEDMGNRWVDLRPMRLEGRSYSLNQIAIPVGIGFRYKLSQRLDLAFEMGCRFTFTDYMDDVSGKYRDRGAFGDDPLAVAMSDRSLEGLQNDSYLQQWVNEHQGYNLTNGYATVNGYGRSGEQRGNPKRKDMYIVTGFHLTYIINGIICPKFR